MKASDSPLFARCALRVCRLVLASTLASMVATVALAFALVASLVT